MNAGHVGRPITGTRVNLTPATLLGLLGAALMVGAIVGAAITSELSLSSNGRNAPVTAIAHAPDHIGLTERMFH